MFPGGESLPYPIFSPTGSSWSLQMERLSSAMRSELRYCDDLSPFMTASSSYQLNGDQNDGSSLFAARCHPSLLNKVSR
jgi:hypothetical protein